MSPAVIYVHGNGNKARREVLKEEWDKALFGQDMGETSRVAYFAHLRYPTPLPDPEFDEVDQMPASFLESVGPMGVEPAELVAETLAEASASDGTAPGPEAETTSDANADRLRGWLQEMAYVADAVVEGEDQVGPEMLPLPRDARVAAFRALVKVTFKDVYAYFFGGFKDRMRATLREALAGTTGPVIVIAHSLGSIIAYDVLREPGQANLDCPLFVTVGSPLGVTEVQDVVERELEVPAAVTAWRNVADGRDLVALDRTIRPEYDPAHRCTDFLVVNDSPNHHGIRQYLASRPVQESVRMLFA
jgi:hypothetical protein